jgi:predicted metal-dependent peptidase
VPEINEQKDKIVIDYAPTSISEQERAELLGMNIQEEFNTISRDLDKFHAIFYQIWDMGYPRLSFDIETACITFDKKGRRIEFLFNPIFWKKSSTYTKMFVICHECLHVILNHGRRIKDLKGGKFWQKAANYALDVVINHMLVDKFNFDRYSIDGQENYCWIDTVFGKDHKDVERNRSFEYYFGLLKQKLVESAMASAKMKIKNLDGSTSDVNGELVDAHEFLEGLDNESLKKEIEENINNNINEYDKKDFVDKLGKTGEGKEQIKQSGKEAGSVAAGIVFKMNLYEKVKKKRKWESVIKKWSLKFIKDEQGVEQWARVNRRINGLNTNLMLPSEVDDQNLHQDKIEVWFFLDVSGSCVHLKDRFFRAVRSLPDDKFIIRLYSFDNEVYDVDMKKGEVYGGGGTSFAILENKIQQEMKTYGKKYPEAVFVMTDGYGDAVKPQFPKKWYWFLSYNYRSYVPQESNIHMLKDYE